jgi:predicted XRE-type DNA-binding protein
MSETIVESSGNVFIDLGYSPDEAAILQMRADLVAGLRKFIKAKKLTQTKVGMRIVSPSRLRLKDMGGYEREDVKWLDGMSGSGTYRDTNKNEDEEKQPVTT